MMYIIKCEAYTMKVYTEKELEKIQKGATLFATEDNELKVGTVGSGKISYCEGSIYTGPLVFTGTSFEKLGYGRQDFSLSTISCDDVGGPIGDTVYLFEGMFDYRKTRWICGNGILYFMKGGKPDSYFPGYFEGTVCVGEYSGPNIESVLLPSFKNTNRLDHLYPKQGKIAKLTKEREEHRDIDFLFIGDSYFDNLNNYKGKDRGTLFEQYKGNNNAINMGIGGWRYIDFIPYLNQLVLCGNTKNLIVNLGFNDIHLGRNADTTLKDMSDFLSPFLAKFPNIRIYLLTVSHFPAFPQFRKEEDKYNEEIKKRFNNDKNVTVIDADTVFENIKNSNLNFTDYIEPDLVHPNEKGYEKWMPYILTRVKGFKL